VVAKSTKPLESLASRSRKGPEFSCSDRRTPVAYSGKRDRRRIMELLPGEIHAGFVAGGASISPRTASPRTARAILAEQPQRGHGSWRRRGFAMPFGTAPNGRPFCTSG